MKRLCVFLVTLALLAENWMVKARPSTALIVRSPRQAAVSVFDDIATNSTDVSLVLEPSAPWEDFIMPSPTVIALLGQLMVISGKVDFSLVENTPKGGFKYMRHPESFRASLVQVSNDGWGAFMNAHKNMDKIQLYMQQVPAQVKTAVKILSQASPKLVERLLPITLKTIQDIGQTCVQLSAETESKFAEVMLLLGELLEVTISSKGTHEEKLAEVQTELNVTAAQKKSLDELGEQIKKRQAQVDEEVAKRRSQYDDALSKIPTGWKAILQDLGRTIVNVVNVIPQAIGMGNLGGVGGGGGGGSIGGPIGGAAAGEFEKASSLGLVRNFFNSIGKMKDTVVNLFHGKTAGQGSPTTMVPAFSTLLDTFEKMFKGTPSEITKDALGFVSEGKSILEELKGLMEQFPAKKVNESDQSKVQQGFDTLQDKMKPYVAQAEAATGGLATGQESSQGGGGGGEGGGVSCTGCNERYKADLALAALRAAEQRQDQIFGETMKYYEQMKDLVGKLAKLNLEEINYKDILELLKQGIQLLAKIREQWGKLVQFFSLVSVRAEVALNQTLVPFVNYAKQAEEMIGQGDLSMPDRQFFMGLLQDQAADINKVAYFLYTLSSTYFDVSTKFLMNRLAGLAQMLATDNEAERQRLLVDLRNQANEAQDAIKQMAQQRREDYTRLVTARKQELQDVVSKLGPSTEADKKAIQSVFGNQN